MHSKSKTVAKTEGNLALTNEAQLHTSVRKLTPTLRLVQAIRRNEDLVEKPIFTLTQLLPAAGFSIALCLLWFLIMAVLYRLIRATFATP